MEREVSRSSSRGVRLLVGRNRGALVGLVIMLIPRVQADEFASPLPEGVEAVWDLGRAHREATPTRERICINGLWRWQPAGPETERPPAENRGFFKVPGCWPGITDNLQKDSQTLDPHPRWKDARLAGINAAWYEREITIPGSWAGRRVALSVEHLNSYASVFVDGEPGGRAHLGATGISVRAHGGARLSPGQVLAVGPGGGRTPAAHAPAIADYLKDGGHLLEIGLDEPDATAFLSAPVRMKVAEHIATCFDPAGAGSLLAGIGPADVHNRDPRELPLITAGAEAIGDGILARAKDVNVVFCQLVPWQFDALDWSNIKRTYRRTSFLVARLLGNMGVAGDTPLLARFATPAASTPPERRWREGLYLDQPEEWDDPYRFFRW